MALSRPKKNKMAVDIEGFLAVSSQPERSGTMARLGIDQEIMDEGLALLNERKDRRLALDEARSDLEMAQNAKNDAKAKAQAEMSSLINLLFRQFYDREREVRLLGLRSRIKTRAIQVEEDDLIDSEMDAGNLIDSGGADDDTPEGSATPAARGRTTTVRVAQEGAYSEASLLEHWRNVLDCIPLLPADALAIVEMFGFKPERLEEVRAAVEKFAIALPLQKSALAIRKQRTRAYNRAERRLHTWLIGVRAMIQPRLGLLNEQELEDIPAIINI